MALYLVGLGLGNEDDISVRGLKIVRGADVVVLEAYTSVLVGISPEKLGEIYGKAVTVADRDMVEQEAEQMLLEPALEGKKVAFLVVGDPVCATTHADLVLRARKRGVRVEIVHNASIMGAAGSCGLQLYNFGQTVSLPFFEPNWRPTSFYPKILCNRRGGMHTLCLLDIKVKEPDFEAMRRGKTVYLPPRYMSIRTASEQLLEVEDAMNQSAYTRKTLCVGLARMGQETQVIRAGTLEELQSFEFGGPLHSLIICGDLHELEVEVLKEYLMEGSQYELEKPSSASEQNAS
jgi:diphthine synthase